jgi:hypothetical protein
VGTHHTESLVFVLLFLSLSVFRRGLPPVSVVVIPPAAVREDTRRNGTEIGGGGRQQQPVDDKLFAHRAGQRSQKIQR